MTQPGLHRLDAEPLVLVIDDEVAISQIIAEVLFDAGYRVEVTEDATSALDLVARVVPSLILLDLRMPGLSGEGFLHRYRELPGPSAPIIVVTAVGEAERDAIAPWAAAVLPKPFDIDELLALVERSVPRSAASELSGAPACGVQGPQSGIAGRIDLAEHPGWVRDAEKDKDVV